MSQLASWRESGPVTGLYWLPALDGEGPPEKLEASRRLEAFLAVRDGTAIVRETTEHSLTVLSGGDGEIRAGAVRKAGAGLWLLHRSADFLAERSALLKEAAGSR